MDEAAIVKAIMYLIGTLGAKGIAELVSSWRIAKRLLAVEAALTASALRSEQLQQEVAAHSERLTALEDLGPVLR